MPAEFAHLSGQYDYLVARGYLIKGTRHILWNRQDTGRSLLAKAASAGALLDEAYIQEVTYQLMNLESEFGSGRSQEIIRNLAPSLEEFGGRENVRRLIGSYAINQAFLNYHSGNYRLAIRETMRAIVNNPKYLTARGTVSLLIRSLGGSWLARILRESDPCHP
jgi:hypothetical protein